jgi:hypothetical protein
MFQYITFICASSILIPALIGMYRVKQIEHTYYPFIMLIVLGLLNEILSIGLALNGIHTTLNNNIYVLLEAVLILWFFSAVNLFNNKKIFYVLLILIVCVWTAEALTVTLYNQCTYYRIIYSFLIVLLSINMINKILASEQRALLKNSLFLICICFTFYYTLNSLVNAFWLYGLLKSREFLQGIQDIMMYTNLLNNLIFTTAIIWIPRKQASILPY